MASTGGAGRIALIGSTAADVRDVMIEGPSGVLATAPNGCRPIYEPSKRKLAWPMARWRTRSVLTNLIGFGVRNFDFGWCDELAAWSYGAEAWNMFALGLRLGSHPRAVITTTPRPTKLIRELLARQDVVVTTDTTYANAANLRLHSLLQSRPAMRARD